jgi:hypothetical protein
MKSFRHFIREQQEDFGHHSKSGRPHLPSITIHDSHGEAHQAPFHSEIEGGKVRYDLTDALEKVKQKGAFFKLADGAAAASKELSDHHAREFTNDMATEGGARGLGKHGVMMLTFTPEHREDGDSEPTDGGDGPTTGRALRMPRSVTRPGSRTTPLSRRRQFARATV